MLNSKIILVVLVLIVLNSCSLKPKSFHFKVMQGLTSKNFSSFNIISDSDKKISIRISQGIKLIPQSLIKTQEISNKFLAIKKINKIKK